MGARSAPVRQTCVATMFIAVAGVVGMAASQIYGLEMKKNVWIPGTET